MRRIFTITLLLSIISSCHQPGIKKDCYLNFSLGMPEYDCKQQVHENIEHGIFTEQFTKSVFINPNSKNVLTTITSLQIQGVFEPIFLNDRLYTIRIFIGEDFCYNPYFEILNMYDSLVGYFKKEYGQPVLQIDSITGHKSNKWDTKYDYSIEVHFVPESKISKKEIAIYFLPTGALKKELDEYIGSKK